jgi:hypothetical protein
MSDYGECLDYDMLEQPAYDLGMTFSCSVLQIYGLLLTHCVKSVSGRHMCMLKSMPPFILVKG